MRVSCFGRIVRQSADSLVAVRASYRSSYALPPPSVVYLSDRSQLEDAASSIAAGGAVIQGPRYCSRTRYCVDRRPLGMQLSRGSRSQRVVLARRRDKVPLVR